MFLSMNNYNSQHIASKCSPPSNNDPSVTAGAVSLLQAAGEFLVTDSESIRHRQADAFAGVWSQYMNGHQFKTYDVTGHSRRKSTMH